MKYMRITAYVLIALHLFLTAQSIAQSFTAMSVVVKNGKDSGLKDAAVVLVDSLGKEVSAPEVTDAGGNVRFKNLPPGDYQVVARHLGYNPANVNVVLEEGENKVLDIVLYESVQALTEVNVLGKTETQQVREQAIKTAVVNTREIAVQPTTLTELVNRTAGIRIRQTGGLGSATDISVNGFQGRSVRYFKDGIPLDYLRDGYNIANVPVNMLERVEVYKGVLPAWLGADALGGAVNIVSRKDVNNSLNGSYEFGSFNTHRASLNGRWVSASGKIYAGADVFFNHSNNDYKAVVKLTDPETRNQIEARLPMFHNAFTSYYGEAYAGVQNTRWADELRISLAGFDLIRQQQHPALMTDPYGAILGKQSSVIPTVRYKKSWLDGKWELDQFLVYNSVNIQRIDTLRGRYDWFGNFIANPNQLGESRQAALSDADYTNFVSRTNLRFRFASHGVLEANYVVTLSGRKGSDPYGPRFDGTDIDVLSVKTDYAKRVLGLSAEYGFFEGKLSNVLMVKNYDYSSAGADTWASRPVDERERIEKSGKYWGVGDALKFKINANSFARLSVETAYRLPQQDELFGDGVFIVPNFNLNPERSTNANLGYSLRSGRSFRFETNVFYRNTKGMILLIPIQPPYAQYNNMENVRGYGLEMDASYRFLGHFSANANFTYQNLRLFGITTQLDSWKNDSRLRNTPWFFANVGLNADFKGFKKTDAFRLYAHYNFMKEYYLETIPKRLESDKLLGLIGSANVASNLIIPTQHLVSTGLSYDRGGRYQLGFELKNILNQDLFDYYRIQRAGRSFHIKIGISLHQSKNHV